MRHRKATVKFSRSRGLRIALIKSLLRAMVINGKMKTTESKAKGIKPRVDKLINWAKEDTLHHRRLAYRLLEDHKLVKNLFEVVGPRFKDIKGGYTRIFRLGVRKGDGGRMALLELTKLEQKEKPITTIEKKIKKEKSPVVAKKREQPPVKKESPKKGFASGMKKIFKKERDAL